MRCKASSRVFNDKYMTYEVLTKGRPDVPLEEHDLPQLLQEAFKLEMRIRERDILFRKAGMFSVTLEAEDVERILGKGYISEYYIKIISQFLDYDMGHASTAFNFLDSGSLMRDIREELPPTTTCPKYK